MSNIEDAIAALTQAKLKVTEAHQHVYLAQQALDEAAGYTNMAGINSYHALEPVIGSMSSPLMDVKAACTQADSAYSSAIAALQELLH